jgi:hypothetical protein
MDELTEFIFSIIVYSIVIVIIISIVVAGIVIWLGLAGLFAVFTGIVGFFEGVANFFIAWNAAHKEAYNRPPGSVKALFISRLYEPQPANLIYFLNAGWFVIGYSGGKLLTLTEAGANRWIAMAASWESTGGGFLNEYITKGAGLGLRVGAVTHYLSSFVIMAFLSAIQIILMIIGTIIASIPIAFISIGIWLYGRINRIYYRCPHCHHQMPIPTHICSSCSTEHSRLWPSVYGILYHKCRGGPHNNCNAKLPTTRLGGRNKLKQICPSCNRQIEGLGGRNVHIPIIGGTSAGKSHYIVMATKQFIEDYAPDHGITTAIADKQQQSNYQTKVDLLNKGERLNKTDDADDTPEAYNVELRKSRLKVPKLMYIYDTAGEHYGSDGRAMKQTYLKYTHGIILIIDPFAINQISREYADKLRSTTNKLAPSDRKPDEIFATMLTTLEHSLQTKPGQQVKRPIAVVIVKSDAFDLERRIGGHAARELMAKNPNIKFTGDAINLLVEQFFSDVGEVNFVKSLRGTFSNVRFFSCSSVGLGGTSAKAFEGVRVLDPLLWLLGQTQHLPTNRERIREVDEKDRLDAKAKYPHKPSYWQPSYWRHYLWKSLKPIDKNHIKST